MRFADQNERIRDGGGSFQLLENDNDLIEDGNAIDVVIAEVTKGRTKINSPFEKEEVLEYILNWIGCLNGKERVKAITYLKKREDFSTDDKKIKVRFVCFGGEGSEIECKQVTLLNALRFIRERFKKYSRFKTDSQQWVGIMKYIYGVAENPAISDGELLKKILDGRWNLIFEEL